MLSESELGRIHRASLQILQQVGIEVLSADAVEVFKSHGAKVEADTLRVRLPVNLVEEAISQAPRRVGLYDRDLATAIELGRGRGAVASGHNAIHVIDSDTGRRRPATKNDIGSFARLADALLAIDVVGIQAMPQDVPARSTLLHAFQAAVTNTSKHIFFSPESLEVVQAILAMARAACGQDSLAPASPVTCQLSPTSPLMWEPGAADGVIEVARAGVPLCILPQPFAGVTCPVTTAGQLALHNAEALSGVVLAQLVQPGSPVIYGSAWTTFEMRLANVLICSPEAAAMRVAGAQLADYYHIPSHTIGPDADAHAHDQQTGWEKMLSTLSALAAGVDLLVNAGMFETGLTVSLEQLVMDAEMVEISRRLLAGVEVSDETLALDVIAAVGPRGDFLTQPHTLNHLRAGALWEAAVSNRSIHEQWLQQGSPDVVARARSRAAELLATHTPAPLAEDRCVAMAAVISKFEKTHAAN